LCSSYCGRGSLAFPVEPLLAFVLFLFHCGILSPAQWSQHARFDDRCKWLLRGLLPSRSQLYSFRDRLEPFLDDWHKQLIDWAIVEGVTSASCGSLDGTFVASWASRHRLVSPAQVDRRLLLLRLLVWLEEGHDHDKSYLSSQLQKLPELISTATWLWLQLPLTSLASLQLLDTLLNLLALLELLHPQAISSTLQQGLWQPRLPAWVPATPAGRQRVLRRYEDAQKRLAQKMRPFQHKKKLSKKDQQSLKYMKASLTDGEAVLGWDKLGTYRPLYNVLLVQATDAPLTLAWDVQARNNDDGMLRPMMQKTKEQVGQHLQSVLVDGAFISVVDVQYCEGQGIKVYAPANKGKTEQADSSKKNIAKSEFR
jgi:hypothetical protein